MENPTGGNSNPHASEARLLLNGCLYDFVDLPRAFYRLHPGQLDYNSFSVVISILVPRTGCGFLFSDLPAALAPCRKDFPLHTHLAGCGS